MILTGKVAIVTGAGQGIGRAIALGLARQGARVVVADTNEKTVQSVAAEIESAGSESLACRTDVSQAASVENLKAATLARFQRIDILVNNAGIYPVCSVREMTEELWNRVIDTNLGGNFLCSRAVIPHMRANKSGRIIAVASTLAYKGAKDGAHYAASKAGIIGFVKALAREVAKDGITVNAICPGVTDTAQPRGHRSEEELLSQAKNIPVGRIGRPEDMVGPVVFLASEAAAYVTGQALIISGGGFML
ncbi:MAG TPA: SDR family NAD(P)-dependent oxidoreductase [Candidatus Eisenbacteria bacterium]|nr:SDR family NAD(P)-dependent oxidoreductase [Candidatus Eisenbacteria bacterium]